MRISTKCSVAVHCLLFIYEYGENRKVTSELLSLSTGSNPVTVRNILSALKKDNIISVRSGTGGAAIICPVNEITLYRVCRAIDPDFLSKLIGIHNMASPLCPIGKNIHTVLDVSYKKISDELSESLKKITLEDIINDYHNI
ncbi:MAG: Rrf2 family transcriptional regulator [Firmicutes bacterium]|nr:Rrf2 family transcriptional regulator [Bacillota bacterium]